MRQGWHWRLWWPTLIYTCTTPSVSIIPILKHWRCHQRWRWCGCRPLVWQVLNPREVRFTAYEPPKWNSSLLVVPGISLRTKEPVEFSRTTESWQYWHFCIEFGNKLCAAVSVICFDSMHRDKFKSTQTFLKPVTISNLFPLEFTQKCQYYYVLLLSASLCKLD